MRKLIRMLSILMIMFVLFSCGKANKQDSTDVASIEIMKENLEFDQNFQLSDIQIHVLMEDGSTSQIPLTHEMLSDEDLLKFKREGEHAINVTYLNASTSFVITIKGEKGDPGVDGNEVLLQVSNGYIQWKYEDEVNWTNLVLLDDIQGENGVDSKEVFFQVAEGYIQWQYLGDTTWTNLVELSTLTGQQGEMGTNGKEVTFQVTDGYIQWQYVGDTTWTNLLGLSTLVGLPGKTGTDGKEITFQIAEGYIQWQYLGDTTWTNLVELSTLVGQKGVAGSDGKEVTFKVTDGYIQWQYLGDTTWTNLVELSTLVGQQGVAGSDGKEVTFKVADDYIQWQYLGDTTWTNLIEIDTLTGVAGVGIESTDVNEFGEMIITYTDGTTVNIGVPLIVYTVNFKDYNGYIIDAQVLTYGSSAIAPVEPTRDGYLFTGWSTSFNEVTEDMVIYALYEVKTYTVSFNSSGGTIHSDILDVAHNSTILLPRPEKIGYAFKGWYLSNNQNARQFYEDSLVNNDLSLYAKWELASYFVHFVDYNGTVISNMLVAHGTSAQAPSDPQREGYTFKMWNQVSSIVTAELIIEAIYNPIDYTITFDSNGGTVVDPLVQPYENILPTLETPYKKGYDFLGWYEDLDSSEAFTDTTMPLNGVTLYAKWELSTYDLIFDTSGGELLSNISTVYGSLVTELPIPKRTDYVFNGWLLNGNKVTSFNYNFESDITLIASWTGLSNGIEFEVSNNEVTILSYTGTETNLILPDTIAGNPITTIGLGAFSGNTSLESIVLGQYVTTIVDNAFSNMTHLTHISLPNSATLIGNDAFTNSNALEVITLSSEMSYELSYFFGGNLNYIPASLGKIKYADGAQLIDKTLLSNNMNGVALELADDYKVIKSSEFNNLIYLTEVIIPNGVTTIESFAFQDSGIQSIHIPSSVISIDYYAFEGTSSLSTVTFDPDSQLTYIGTSAFSNSALQSITIPSSVTTIDSGAFEYTNTLHTVIFEDNSQLISIGSYAFNSGKLTSVFIPSSVTTLGSSVFYKNSNLVIYTEFASKPEGWDTNWDSSNSVIWAYLETIDNGTYKYAISNNTVSILGLSDNATVVDLVIPAFIDGREVIQLVNGAFKNNEQLLSIQIPYTIREIQTETFMNATNLQSATFDAFSQLESIGPYAFSNSSLTSITIPSSVTTIGNYAFYNAKSLTTVTFKANSQLKIIDSYAFNSASALIEMTIPSSVTSIGAYSFFYTSSLTTVIFEENSQLTMIGNSAFSRTLSLKNIRIPLSVTTIHSYAFSNDNPLVIFVEALSQPSDWAYDWNSEHRTVVWGYLETVDNGIFKYAISRNDTVSILGLSDGATAVDLVIPEMIDGKEVTQIVNGAFKNNVELLSIEIPHTIKEIQFETFMGATNLQTVTIDKLSQLERIESHAFYDATSLTSITIPSNVTSIGWHAFYNASLLATVVFEENSHLLSIGGYAFYNAGALTSLTIPSSVTSIGNHAFFDASLLTTVTFEENSQLSIIEAYAFQNTHSLTSIIIPINVTSIGKLAFSSYTNALTIYTEALSPLSGWDIDWNDKNRPVVWGIIGYGTYQDFDYVITRENTVTLLGQTDKSSTTDLVIPELIEGLPVTSIQDYAFYKNMQLTSIYIPSSIVNIGNYTFKGASNIEIHAQVESKPEGWHSYWNPDYQAVQWGYVWV